MCLEHGGEWCEVVEVYPDDGSAVTEDGVRPGGESRAELIEDLTRMLHDVTEWPVVEAEE